MDRGIYSKGNAMTFSLELTEIKRDREQEKYKYLYPAMVAPIQMEIEEICDRMEYDGSMMFDECPDKVTVEKTVKKICKSGKFENCDSSWFSPLVQVMLCNEMQYRKQRRRNHKMNMR